MDRTETYIKMSDCEEIQKLSPFDKKGIQWGEVGSWYAEGISEGNILCFGSIGADYKFYREHYSKEVIWLPLQDQLQEMIEPTVGYPNSLVCEFWEWFDECNGIDNDIAFTSMEQLWLAFYMSEKYNKTWNGERWE